MSIIAVPDEILSIINEFCPFGNLLQTCSILYHVRARIGTYRLNRVYSNKYYTGIRFRNKVLQRITDIRKQLHINLYKRFTNVSNILKNVHTLNLSGCYGLTDVSALGNVHTLNLSYCTGITDVSALGNVHTLDLSVCYKVTHVSMLGSVHDLIL